MLQRDRWRTVLKYYVPCLLTSVSLCRLPGPGEKSGTGVSTYVASPLIISALSFRQEYIRAFQMASDLLQELAYGGCEEEY